MDDRLQQLTIGALQTLLVDLQQLERLARDRRRDLTGMTHLSDVADAAQDPVGDARGPPRPPRDLVG